MKSELFLRIIGDIDDDLITEAGEKRRFSPRFVRIAGGIAACFVIAAAVVIAAPILTRTMHDDVSMENAAADTAGDYWYTADKIMEEAEIWSGADGADEKHFSTTAGSASGSVSGNTPAETAAPTVNPTARPETGMADTALPQPLMGRTFYFYDGKTWRTEVKTYPGGLPSMQEIVNDYLAAAGLKVQCTGARSEVVGEKDEVKNGIVTHTVGVRTWYITLDGEISEALFRGLVNTVLESASPSSLYLVQADTPAGTLGPAQASRLP